jgi:hypothetical protein
VLAAAPRGRPSREAVHLVMSLPEYLVA